MFLNGGALSRITTRKGHSSRPFTSGLWQGRLMTASRKAERLSGVGLPKPSPRGSACRRVPDTGKARKMGVL